LIRGALAALVAAAIVCGCVSTQPTNVVRIIDGDTIVVKHGSRTVHLRLAGVDSPERDSPGGAAATEFTRALCGKANVVWQQVAIDKYHRVVAHISCDGLNLAHELRAAGHIKKKL
jgi:endonuclease YncB( thermonuclease family)